MTRNCQYSGSSPGIHTEEAEADFITIGYLYNHQSVVVGSKIYMYGGSFSGTWALNKNIYVLDTSIYFLLKLLV